MKLFYRKDDYNNGYRVWRSDWPWDAFEILSVEEFQQLKTSLKPFSLLWEADDE